MLVALNNDPNYDSKEIAEFNEKLNCIDDIQEKMDYISKIKRISNKDNLIKSHSMINEFMIKCNKVVLMRCIEMNIKPIRIRKP